MGKTKSLDPRSLERVKKILENQTKKIVKITPKEAAEQLEGQIR